MDSCAVGAYLILSFGAIFILFGLKNLIENPALGVFSLAAMAVMFGVVLSTAGVILRRPSGSPEPDT
ncbi:MAG: hypothetical protein JRN06_10090 [Nitrososphaerota archaeon]|nr:hypothetical protein [Nitrososphaerota archaeon]MDG7024937.1 hypothetical protein [Nitrososphaerota archaeon]